MGRLGFAGRLADRMIDSPLVPLIVLGALLVGSYGLALTPREDRPEIEVPNAVIFIAYPGAGVARVDELVARPVGAWAGQLQRVVEVNSVASADAALIQVEFVTGITDAQAYGELKEMMERNRDRLPPGAAPEVIQTVGEERMAGVMVTLSSPRYSAFELRRIAAELAVELEAVSGVRAVELHGGQSRQIQILPRLQDLAAHGSDLLQLFDAVAAASLRLPADSLRGDLTRQVRAGALPGTVDELERIQVGAGPAGVVYLHDVADVVDGPAPAESRSLHWELGAATEVPAVSLAVTSIPHSNISAVAERTLERVDELRGTLLPADVGVRIAYDAGRAATETVMSVLGNFVIATVVVVAIILLGLGWRAAVGVSVLIPTILAIVPFAYLWLGFTLNPVSIAAMILAIGLIADDTVIIMENIGRHFRQAGRRSRELTVRAVDEVGNPTILAVFLIIATLLPTAFITGEMGQYTRAIPTGASLAVLFSLTIALTVTPFVAYRLLRPPAGVEGASREDDEADTTADIADEHEIPPGRLADGYRALLDPLFTHTWLRWLLYLVLALLMVGSASMVALRAVQLTLVPFLDREIFIIEMEVPTGTPLERTLEATAAVGRELRRHEEVEAYTVFAGTDGPLLLPPPGPPDQAVATSHRASIYVQLPPEGERRRLSYQLSRDLLDRLPDVLAPHAGAAWIRRIPSGPSSDNDVEAEIYGPDRAGQQALAATVADLLERHPAAVSLEQFPKPRGPELQFTVDTTRAAARGVLPARVTGTVQMALGGRTVTEFDLPGERHPVPVLIRLRDREREWIEDLEGLQIHDAQGQPVPLLDLIHVVETDWTPNRHRRNQLPVVYVAAEINRDRSQPLSVQRDIGGALRQQLPTSAIDEMPEIRWFSPPDSQQQTTLFWGGEWEMTQQVYRDLAIAGVAVLLVIYTLLAAWFRSYVVPLLIMMPIPLVFVGVIPAHWLLGLDIAGLGILGVIALAGIVVRNAVLLVDFTERRIERGMPMQDALISAGVLRTRPILLTAGTVMFGSGALVFEPALQPLGLTLVSGALVSTLLTLLLIPTLYFHCYHRS